MQMNPNDKTNFILPPPFAKIRKGFIFAMDAKTLILFQNIHPDNTNKLYVDNKKHQQKFTLQISIDA